MDQQMNEKLFHPVVMMILLFIAGFYLLSHKENAFSKAIAKDK